MCLAFEPDWQRIKVRSTPLTTYRALGPGAIGPFAPIFVSVPSPALVICGSKEEDEEGRGK